MTLAEYIQKFVTAYGKNSPADLVLMNARLQGLYKVWVSRYKQKKKYNKTVAKRPAAGGRIVYMAPLDYRDKIIGFIHRPVIRFFIWVVYLATVAGAPFLDYFSKADYKTVPPSRDWTGFVIFSLLLCLVCYWLGIHKLFI